MERFRVTLNVANTRTVVCTLEIPKEHAVMDQDQIAEALAGFYQLHPDTEVLSIMKETVLSEEILRTQALPCEDNLCQVRMDDAKSVIEAVMTNSWNKAA